MTTAAQIIGNAGFWVSLGAYFVCTIYAGGGRRRRHRLGANSLSQAATLTATASCVVMAFTSTWVWWITAAIQAGLFVFTATASRRSLRDLMKAEADLDAVEKRLAALYAEDRAL